MHGNEGTTLAGFGRWTRIVHRTRRGLWDTLLDWQERAAQRRRLAAMSDLMLGDIGLSRADIARERAKPFWRI